MNTVSSEHLFSDTLLEPEYCLQKSFQRLFRNTVILIAGPTCVGKTDISLKIAEILGGEIISADSMQVYKDMDIGTAKASWEDRCRIPHHLIDIRRVSEPFNVVDFYYESKQACQAILNRGKVPILVGGAGFYFHVFVSGPPSGPPSDPSLRKELEIQLQEIGCEAMYGRLKNMDPEYAMTITAHDRHKIVRAFEIMHLTKMKVSEHRKEELCDKDFEYNYRAWYLSLPKERLYERIEQRCDAMMEMGLIEEVAGLLSKGIENNYSAENSIGYKQWINFLAGSRSPERYEEALMQFKRSSKSYAKRQATWFKKHNLFQNLDVSMMLPEETADLIVTDYYLNS